MPRTRNRLLANALRAKPLSNSVTDPQVPPVTEICISDDISKCTSLRMMPSKWCTDIQVPSGTEVCNSKNNAFKVMNWSPSAFSNCYWSVQVLEQCRWCTCIQVPSVTEVGNSKNNAFKVMNWSPSAFSNCYWSVQVQEQCRWCTCIQVLSVSEPDNS